jgi:hypothetical protein
MIQEYRPATAERTSDQREIRFFSEARQEIYNLSEVGRISDEDIDFLLSEGWSMRVSLSLVVQEAHEKIENGEVIDRQWLKRVKYKYKVIKSFMHGLREEKGLRRISRNPEECEKLRQQLASNDTPESESVDKIDAAINRVISYKNRENVILLELVAGIIGNKKLEELRREAKLKSGQPDSVDLLKK